MEFNCTLKPDGTLVVHRRKTLDNWLASQVKESDQPFLLKIEKQKKTRSTEVNKYWWKVIIPIIQRGLNDLGHDLNKEETHEFLKLNFCYEEIVNEETGEVFRKPMGTSKLSGREMWELIERVARFAAEQLHEVIPAPNEQATMEFNT